MLQISSLNQAYGEEKISILAIVFSMIGIYFFFGIALMIFAKPISKLLFQENEKLTEETNLTATTLIQAAVPLVGLYFLITYFPSFITTAIQWYKEKAGPPTGFPAQYGLSMAHATIMIVLSLLIILRSKTISRFLTRSTN